MLKNILKLDGAQQLSKKEQKEVNGGKTNPRVDKDTCPCRSAVIFENATGLGVCIQLSGPNNKCYPRG
jgi:hypothetical protein